MRTKIPSLILSISVKLLKKKLKGHNQLTFLSKHAIEFIEMSSGKCGKIYKSLELLGHILTSLGKMTFFSTKTVSPTNDMNHVNFSSTKYQNMSQSLDSGIF